MESAEGDARKNAERFQLAQVQQTSSVTGRQELVWVAADKTGATRLLQLLRS